MPWRIHIVFVGLGCLCGLISASVTDLRSQRPSNTSLPRTDTNNNINIIFDKDPGESAAGSGAGVLISDDEDLVDSGSGSGSGMGVIILEGTTEKMTTVTTSTIASTVTTTTRSPTPCEQSRQTNHQLSAKYVPRCLPNGEYDALQCQGHPGTGDCWCSDLEGKEIPGTLTDSPEIPNCDTGKNLPACVFMLVQEVRSKLLGGLRPKCTSEGQFEHIQCHGSLCFCVDESSGKKVTGTEVYIPDTPNCDDDSIDVPESSTQATLPDYNENNEDNFTIDEDVGVVLPEDKEDTIDLDMDIGSSPEKSPDTNERLPDTEDTHPKFQEENQSKNKEVTISKSDRDGYHGDRVEKAGEIMTQPGILAGIIGGSVVLLLCLVLLVMFVVYRMRKKDEGSYPLDEPRKPPNYNYVRAPDKEIYA